MWFPPLPDHRETIVESAEFRQRFEDLLQDGRLSTLALPAAMGTIWREVSNADGIGDSLRSQGVAPILTRLYIEAGDESFGVARPFSVTGGFWPAHVKDERGDIRRLVLNLWLTMRGPRGHHVLPVEGAGTEVAAGRIFAEHVFTRPFAPPQQRRVTALQIPGLPAVPPEPHDWHPMTATVELPDGAHFTGEWRQALEMSFTLAHTDSNQHVNSLVYPRLVESAALQAVANRPGSARLCARRVVASFRKPFFAGDRFKLDLRLFECEDRVGAVACFYPADESRDAAHAYARVLLG
jgi:hypothetical protein